MATEFSHSREAYSLTTRQRKKKENNKKKKTDAILHNDRKTLKELAKE